MKKTLALKIMSLDLSTCEFANYSKGKVTLPALKNQQKK